ncbi:MAG: pyrroline-5-carboxylate reductase, partial [Lachnospiraceae bacterium]|nr:pyrroline-5-carboxylate reductase [Lachnospiraceae bacterium]
VIEEIATSVSPDTIVISIAPGKSISWITEKFGRQVRLIRCMPNTPALVGEGMTGFCVSGNVTEEDKEKAKSILEAFGRAEEVPEELMAAVTSVSGSSPAYVFILIEAMADQAVADGMPRAQAYEFAAQAVLGSAKMVLETGRHPGELKDMVCSPAGTTIDAVKILEKNGFRAAVEEAMAACTEKAGKL